MGNKLLVKLHSLCPMTSLQQLTTLQQKRLARLR